METWAGDPDYVHKDFTPNPGSDEAVEMGCICPIMDNHYGKGYMGNPDVFIYNSDCPVHTNEE